MSGGTGVRVDEGVLKLQPGSRLPLYLQVAESVLDAIRRRQFPPGRALPSVRDLADHLSVTVNTILAALRELQAQGWLTSQERSGFFVADPLPEGHQVQPGPGAAVPGFDLPAHLQPVTSTANVVMDLTDGWADARLAPFQALGRAYQRGLKLKGAQLLGSRDPLGLPRLREGLAALLRETRALGAEPGQILVLRSSSMAVTLVAQALIGAGGGTVAVEDPGQPEVWESLRQACPACLRGLPVDGDGADPDALEALLAEGPLKLLVLTPHCQWPTGVQLSALRRARILDLARRHRFPILELAGDLDYQAGRVALAAEDPGQVLHYGSLSRSFAPGLGVGYLVVPGALAQLLARTRQRIDWQGDPVQEWALAELILDGELARQILRVRRSAGERLEAVLDALGHALGERLRPRAGAMALWLEGAGPLAEPKAFTAWIRACQAQGLKLRPGRHYRLGGQDAAATRLGFTAFTPEELQRAVAMMG